MPRRSNDNPFNDRGLRLQKWRQSRRPNGEPRFSDADPMMLAGDLGGRVGQSEHQIKKFEAGQRAIPLRLGILLCRITGIPLEQLVVPDDIRMVEEAAPLLGFSRAVSVRKKSSRKRSSPPASGGDPQSMAAVGAPA